MGRQQQYDDDDDDDDVTTTMIIRIGRAGQRTPQPLLRRRKRQAQKPKRRKRNRVAATRANARQGKSRRRINKCNAILCAIRMYNVNVVYVCMYVCRISISTMHVLVFIHALFSFLMISLVS